MSSIDELPPPRASPNQERIQSDALEEHTELWWSREPVKSILCYSFSVLLILACGIGGIVLLSTTTSPSGEWRMGVGATLCILALLVLLKQLLSSAIQDMQCLTRREHINMLKSGGLSDSLVFLVSSLVILACGVALLVLSFTGDPPGYPSILVTMHTVGVTLVVVGLVIILGLFIFLLVIYCRPCCSRRFSPRNIGVFSISGQLHQRQNTTSSLANLI
ncbi:transmembrane protein 125 [Hyla sarda]|uniref:transmembrane protein 125 n=1 Tax=Hyla sarda TaxID=327740 RepID=UPI0024C33862|nr:transmembrane protein 125 [Hyla sarda]XP_056388998.1 transmembrane protein 125 [Hyla sarda]XP_056388999.1 transmembrane protein 125 [Hyla sarda]